MAHVLGMVLLRTILPSIMSPVSENVKSNFSHAGTLVTVGVCVVGVAVGEFVVGLSEGDIVGMLVGDGCGGEHAPKSTETVKSHGRKNDGATFVNSPTK